MKETYTAPEMELIEFETEDVITTSENTLAYAAFLEDEGGE